LDGCDGITAVTKLTGEPRPNGKDNKRARDHSARVEKKPVMLCGNAIMTAEAGGDVSAARRC
jgi:hypothetical protein